MACVKLGLQDLVQLGDVVSQIYRVLLHAVMSNLLLYGMICSFDASDGSKHILCRFLLELGLLLVDFDVTAHVKHIDGLGTSPRLVVLVLISGSHRAFSCNRRIGIGLVAGLLGVSG